MRPAVAQGVEPLSDWLGALGASAQARSDGLPGSTDFARRAIAAIPAGGALTRARLELALARDGGVPSSVRVAALLESLSAAPPAARGALQLLLGEARLEAGDPKGALEPLRTAAAEGGKAPGATARGALRLIPFALHAAGMSAEAVAAWRALGADRVPNGLEPPARFAYALDLHATGASGRAAELLRELWANQPEHPAAAQAESTLAAWREAGEPVRPLTGAERLDRAWRLLSQGRPAEARAELARGAELPFPADPAQALLADAFAALALGRHSEAATGVEPLVSSGDPSLRRGAQLVLARAASRERRLPEAIAAWKAVAASSASIPGLAPAALATLREDAGYFAAWLHLDVGDLDRAAADLSRYARSQPGSRRADDARWFAAWALVRKGASAEAEPALRRLEEGAAAPRVRYWRARIATDPAVAAPLLRSVAAAEPLGYYGHLACARLAELGERCPPPSLGPARANGRVDAAVDPAPLGTAALLAGLGLRDAALAELAQRTGSNGDRRLAPAAAELASFLGDPLLPFRAARDQLGLSRRTLAWSFPEPWPHLVDRAAAATAVDPTLIRAIMRRESGFQPGVRSQAGAMGLLQLIPPTAARLGALLQLPGELPPRLGEPETNVPLGAAYFSLLQERFGHPIPAIAAYNAGPAAVGRWLRDRGDLPLDAWVESIPYRETRQYVRAVIENWVGARLAAGAPSPEFDLAPRGTIEAKGIAF